MSVRADGNTLGDSAAARVPGPLGEGGEGGVAVGGYEAEALGVVKEIVRAQQQVCVFLFMAGVALDGCRLPP